MSSLAVLPVVPQSSVVTQSPFIIAALNDKSAREVALMVGCNLGTAKECLAQAHRTLRQRRENCQRAVEVTLADGLVRQDISRRAWEDVALGLKRTAQ